MKNKLIVILVREEKYTCEKLNTFTLIRLLGLNLHKSQ